MDAHVRFVMVLGMVLVVCLILLLAALLLEKE